MRVGVAEIMETGHITLAETICRIFCCDPGNQVYLFTLEKHAGNLAFLHDLYPNLFMVIRPSGKNMEEFINETGVYKLDRIYLVTLTKYFRTISKWHPKTRLFLVIHNIDEWFGISPAEAVRRFFYSISGSVHLNLWVYFFKVSFVFPFYKNEILRKVRKSDGCLVVLSRSVLNRLNSMIINSPSEVIPFSLFDPSLVVEKTSADKEVRICVPGILSQYRRNYLALFDVMENHLVELKTLFVLDLLGGVQYDNQFDNPLLLLERIDSLRRKGFSIIVHTVHFIAPLEYDKELSKADIILGNMNVNLNRYSSYGKTKETGIPFAMIRAAKPGILPETYPYPEEISSSTLKYKDFNNLGEILVNLISNREKIEDLKKKALVNSKKFSPESIYKNIVGKQLD
jgi:hypothetical protein